VRLTEGGTEFWGLLVVEARGSWYVDGGWCRASRCRRARAVPDNLLQDSRWKRRLTAHNTTAGCVYVSVSYIVLGEFHQRLFTVQTDGLRSAEGCCL